MVKLRSVPTNTLSRKIDYFVGRAETRLGTMV